MAGKNRFAIVVTAEDDASAILDKIRAGLGKFKKPTDDADKSLRRFADSPALKGLNDWFERIGFSAGGANTAISSLVPSFATLTGLGTIAGIAAFEGHWISSAAAMYRASQAIGDTFEELQLIEGANRRVGGSVGDATNAMHAFGNTLQDAITNRAPEAWALLQQLHIGLKKNASGAVDSTQALMDLADAYQRNLRVSPQTAEKIASVFGLDQLGPLLRNGSSGLRELMEETRNAGAVMSPEAAKKATELQRTLVNLEDAATGAGNEFALVLAPGIDAAAKSMTGWMRELQTGAKIAQQPGYWSQVWDEMKYQMGLGGPTLGGALARKAGVTRDTTAIGYGDVVFAEAPGAETKPSGPTQTPYTASAGWARQTPLIDTPSDDLLTAARRNPITVPDMAPTGKVTVDVNVRGLPPGSTANVAQTGAVDASARVETTMQGYGP